MIGHAERVCPVFAWQRHALRNGRNDVSRPLHLNRVAHPDILACHLVSVMERRPADCDAANLDGLQQGEWRQGAGAADRDGNILNLRDLLPRRELVRDCPPGAPRFLAERLLPIAAVDLDHDSIHLEREVLPGRLRLRVKGNDLLD